MHQLARDITGVGKTELQLVIAAPVDRVWEIWTDVERWPEYTSLIESAYWTSEEPWSFGSTFNAQIKSPFALTFKFVVTGFEPRSEVRWFSFSAGVVVERWTRFATRGSGTSIISSVIYFAPTTPEVPEHLSELIPQFSERFYADLKSACERKAA